MPTSSLINCPQGHVYSAVYQFCPYCPQPESASQGDFATRIEESVTAYEPSAAPQTAMPSSDFSTQAEPYATNFETRIGAAENYETGVRPAEMFETRIGSIDLNQVVDNQENSPIAQKIEPKASAPTEVISNFAETTLAEIPVIGSDLKIDEMKNSAPEDLVLEPVQETPLPPPAPVAKPAKAMPSDQVQNYGKSVAPDPAVPYAPEIDRRTIVVADESIQGLASKGKIVGWLISYTRVPDGEDHRIYAGYNRIGANPVCDIVVDDETVSGSHAIIVFRDGRFLIKDDLSRNGTFVNGREISEAYSLKSYDQIRVGNTVLTFVSAEPIV